MRKQQQQIIILNLRIAVLLGNKSRCGTNYKSNWHGLFKKILGGGENKLEEIVQKQIDKILENINYDLNADIFVFISFLFYFFQC